MARWYNYCFVLPIRDVYVDDGTRDLCTVPIKIRDVGDFEVSLIGTATSVEMIRVTTLNSDGNLTETQSKTVVKLNDHMLAVLRFAYDAEVQLYHKGTSVLG